MRVDRLPFQRAEVPWRHAATGLSGTRTVRPGGTGARTQEPREAARPRVAEAWPSREAGTREGRGASRRIGRRSLSPHEVRQGERGLGDAGGPAAFRRRGSAKRGPGGAPWERPARGIPAGAARGGAGTALYSAEGGDGRRPGAARAPAPHTEKAATAPRASEFRRAAGGTRDIRRTARRGRGMQPSERPGARPAVFRGRRSGGDLRIAGEFHGDRAPGAGDSGVRRPPGSSRMV